MSNNLVFKMANYKHIFLDTSILINAHLNLEKLEQQKLAAASSLNIQEEEKNAKAITVARDCQAILEQIGQFRQANKSFKLVVSSITIAEIFHLKDGTDVVTMWEDLLKEMQVTVFGFAHEAAEKVRDIAKISNGFKMQNQNNICDICNCSFSGDSMKDDYKILGSFMDYIEQYNEPAAILTTDKGFKLHANHFNIPSGSSCFLVQDLQLKPTAIQQQLFSATPTDLGSSPPP